MKNNTSKNGVCFQGNGRFSARAAVVFLIGAYLFGGISLLSWVTFLSRGSLGIVNLDLGQTGALLFDTLLSLVFFIQHSLMVRTSFKRWLVRRIRQEYHGAIYAMASGTALLGLSVFWQGPVQRYTVLHGFPSIIMQVLSLLALAGFVWGVRSLGSFNMFGSVPIVRLLKGTDAAEPMPLVIRGFYRWVRHPLYFSCLMAIWSVTDITVDRLLYNIMWTGWIIVGTMLEERDLVAAFGIAYQAYQARVSMLIPWRIRSTKRTRSPSLSGQLCDDQNMTIS
jgi:methanethiol S-methyltransferase